jgi:hypothetical protein
MPPKPSSLNTGISSSRRRSPSAKAPPLMTSSGKLKFMSRHILTKSAGSGAEIVKRKRLRRPFRRYLWADYQPLAGGSKETGTRKMHPPKRRLRKNVEKLGLPECSGMQWWRLHIRRRQESALQGTRDGSNPYGFKRFEPKRQRTFQCMCHVHTQLVLQSRMWIQVY